MAITFNADTTNGAVITSDTSGEIELQANGVTKAKVTANGLQDANGNSLRGGSFRSLILNGDMSIAQRSTSVAGITGSGYYTVDRFYLNLNIGTWTQSQDTDVPSGQGFAKSLKMQCTSSASLSAGSLLEIHQMFEGQNVQHIKKGTANAESLTLSFWVKTNKTGTYTTSLIDNDNTRHIGATYTVSSADTWEKKTITFSGDTSGALDNDNNASLRVIFHLANGTDWTSGTADTIWGATINANRAVGLTVNLADSTSNYINITGCQLEIGDGASDFEFLPYDVQLTRCQRYYEKSWNQSVSVPSTDTNGAVAMVCMANSSTTLQNNGVRHNFQHRKRTAPTVTVYPIASTTAGSISYARHSTPIADATASLTNASEMSIRVGGTGSGLTTGYAVELLFHYTADAEL